MIFQDEHPPELPIRAVRSHACDGCGAGLGDPDELL